MMPTLMLAMMLAAQAPADEDAPPPSKALLEFVASFQSVDGEWLDPLLLPEAPGPDQTEDERDDENTNQSESDPGASDKPDPGQRGSGR